MSNPPAPPGAPHLSPLWELTLGPLGSLPLPYPDARQPDSVIVTSGSSIIRVDGGGREALRVDLGEAVMAAPAVADLDDDGAPEIIAARRDGLVIALSGDGGELWRHRLGAPFPDFKCVVAAPLGDDGPHLLLADNDGWVTCLDRRGRLRWRFKVDPYRASPPAVGDVDGDGSPEVVYGTDRHRVVCLAADGRLRWQFQEPHNFGRSLPLIADLGNGPEVLITSSSPPFGSHLHCIEGATGLLRWAGDLAQQAYAALAVADIDRDGRPEIITADKSNTVFCFDGGGQPRWAVGVGGHGIFWSPAVADVDGDGELEILVGVRNARPDGRNFFLLTPQGRIKGEYALGKCQNTAPAVGDFNHDGVLEIITSAPQDDAMRCFTFGGPRREGAVAWPCFRAASNLAGSPAAPSPPHAPRPLCAPAGEIVDLPQRLDVGGHDLALRFPPNLPARTLVEVSRLWNGQRETRAYDYEQVAAVRLEIMPGQQEIEAALVEGARGERSLAQKRTVTGVAEQSAVGAEALDAAGVRSVIAAADAAREGARRAGALARFTRDLRRAGWAGPFAAWPDDNPWDNIEPLAALPAPAVPEPTIEVWALGNEHEHAALNLAALEGRPVTVHAAVEGLSGQVELLRPVWMPTRFGGRVPDLLVRSASAAVVDIAPQQPAQLWLHLDTRGLAPGAHQGAVVLTSLEPSPSRLRVGLRLEVSPVTLPDLPRTRVCTWRQVMPDGSGGLDDRVWRDLREHGVTVVYARPPAQECDQRGRLMGEPEWRPFDAAVRRLVAEGAVLFISNWGVRGPVEAWSPAWMEAMRAAAVRFDAHLHSIGIGNDRWLYYPVDEPCLTGDDSVERFLHHARLIREVAPQIRIYANPAGAVTADYLRRMSPYVDVWCPELAVVKQGPAEWLEIMRSGGRPVWCYEAPGYVRTLKPLGFYRMQPWVAARRGLQGSGYWVYAYSNLWGVGPEEPDWGAAQVEPDGALTTTRRWEASRDGIEDSTLLHLLAEAIAAAETTGADASAARALRQEALDAVAARQDAIDDLMRPLVDYEMDLAAVQAYRRRLAEAIIELRG